MVTYNKKNLQTKHEINNVNRKSDSNMSKLKQDLVLVLKTCNEAVSKNTMSVEYCLWEQNVKYQVNGNVRTDYQCKETFSWRQGLHKLSM